MYFVLFRLDALALSIIAMATFFTNLKKDSVANYEWIWMLFSLPVRGLDVLYKALNVS